MNVVDEADGSGDWHDAYEARWPFFDLVDRNHLGFDTWISFEPWLDEFLLWVKDHPDEVKPADPPYDEAAALDEMVKRAMAATGLALPTFRPFKDDVESDESDTDEDSRSVDSERV